MPGRPGTLPWNFAAFSGAEPVTTLSDNFSFLNNQINDSGVGFVNYALDTGTTNNLVITLPSAPVAYETGMMVVARVVNTNTGATVINVNALGNISVVNPANIALTGGELSANCAVALVYDGSVFRIVGPCALNQELSAVVGNVTIECAGYTSVTVAVFWSSSTSTTVFLSHLSAGVPVSVMLANSSGTPNVYAINASNPAGTTFAEVGATFPTNYLGGPYNNLTTGGASLTNGNRIIYTGVSQVDRLSFTA